jgi:hypothetical protein
MDHDALEKVERQLASLPRNDAPYGLRAAVLANVSRELRAAQWDRRLARTASALLLVGVGLNMAIGLPSADLRGGQSPTEARASSQQSLLDAAIVVAEATDAATASRFARQLAAMSGQELTHDQAAQIDAAVSRAADHGGTNGNRG